MGMAADGRITWLRDVRPADWIGPRLNGFAVDTGSVIPRGFEAYCRIFHPVRKSAPGRDSASWAEVAAGNGIIVHPEMQIHTISHPVGSGPPPPYDLNDYRNELDWGELPLPERAVLVDVLRTATTTPHRCWFCIWEGFGFDFDGVPERVQLPHRDYVLYGGPIDLALAALDTGPPDIDAELRHQPWDTHSPNLWWPEDRAWFVATEIDYAWTYVGGTTTLIESVLASDGLEALPAQLTDQPFVDGDTLNSDAH
jgi:hypothetical protein